MSLEINEQTEHAAHAAHAKDPFLQRVSITIAVLAAVTAVTSSLEQLETAAAITESSKAVLAQNQASDQWAFYQSKSVKKHIYALAADENYPNAEKYKKTSAKEGKDGDEITKKAGEYEKKRDELNAEGEKHEQRHHMLAAGATLLEMGIAICTIAIITRQKWWWLSSIVLGVGGVAVAVCAFVLLA